MTGWKTKVGGICTFLGGLCYAAAGAIPRADWKPWLDFAATVFGAAGVGLLGVGISHKIEKAAK